MEGSNDPLPVSPQRVGRYSVHDAIARGGMATVHVGRLEAEGGFARTVAIKRLHAHLSHDPDFVAGFLDEARMCARIRHPNVVPTLDVVSADGEVCIVMEYVEGLALSQLTRASGRLPPPIAVAVVLDVLRGLHAAHEARNDKGDPLGIVHRDVSPQNVLVGADGVARVIDFGVAKAMGNSWSTQEGQVKGKLHYMAPEQVSGLDLDRRTDVFAAGIVLWETLVGRRLFYGDSPAAIVRRLIEAPIPPPSSIQPEISPALDAVVLHALARDRDERFATALEMEVALESALRPAPVREIAAYVAERGAVELARRAEILQAVESAHVESYVRVTMPTVSDPTAISETSSALERPARPERPRLLTRFAPAVALVLAAVTVFVVAIQRRPQGDAGRTASPQALSGSVTAAPKAAPSSNDDPAPAAATATASDAGSSPFPPARAEAHAAPKASSRPAASRPPARPARPKAETKPAASAADDGIYSRQ